MSFEFLSEKMSHSDHTASESFRLRKVGEYTEVGVLGSSHVGYLDGVLKEYLSFGEYYGSS